MNKKLLAMLFVVVAAPMSQGFAVEPSFLRKVSNTMGWQAPEGGDRNWANLGLYTGGSILVVGSTIYLGVRAYQDPENVGDAMKAFFTADGEGITAAMDENGCADIVYASGTLCVGGLMIAGKLLWDAGCWVFHKKTVAEWTKDKTDLVAEFTALAGKTGTALDGSASLDDDAGVTAALADYKALKADATAFAALSADEKKAVNEIVGYEAKFKPVFEGLTKAEAAATSATT